MAKLAHNFYKNWIFDMDLRPRREEVHWPFSCKFGVVWAVNFEAGTSLSLSSTDSYKLPTGNPFPENIHNDETMRIKLLV